MMCGGKELFQHLHRKAISSIATVLVPSKRSSEHCHGHYLQMDGMKEYHVTTNQLCPEASRKISDWAVRMLVKRVAQKLRTTRTEALERAKSNGYSCHRENTK